MPERLSVPGSIRPREVREQILIRSYPIAFEPGIHPAFDYEYQEIHNAFLRGDPNAHVWNPEVGRRLSFYQPKLLTIDGSNIFPLFPGYENGYIESKESLWKGLPTQPRNINRSGNVLALRTDQLTGKRPILSAFQLANGERDPLGSTIDVSLAQESDVFSKLEVNTPITTTLKIAGIAGLPVGLLTAAICSGRGLRKEDPISRRRLLRTAAGGGVLFAASGISVGAGFALRDAEFAPTDLGIKRSASLATTPEEKDQIIANYDATSTKTIDTWTSARNALYVFKTKGAYDALGLGSETPSAIVAGDNHLTGMTRMLSDEQFAAEALRQYVGELFGVVDTFFAQGGTSAMSPDQAKRLIVDTVALTAIDNVDQPDENQFRADPEAAVAQAVTRIQIYQDPRTLQALAPLLQ